MIKRIICVLLTVILCTVSFTGCGKKQYIYRKLCEEYYADGKPYCRIEYAYNQNGGLTQRNTTYLTLNLSTSETYTYENEYLSSLTTVDENGVSAEFKAIGDKYNQSFYYSDESLYKVMQYDEYGNLKVEAFGENNTKQYEYTYDKSGKIISLSKTVHTPSGSENTVYYSCTYNESACNYVLTDTENGMKDNAYISVSYERIKK